MDDRAFFDLLRQLWEKTTNADQSYWEPAQFGTTDEWGVWSVDRDGKKVLVAAGLTEQDADFITGVHGCLPDLVRRLNHALDEADRADLDRDEREQMIASLSRQLDGLANM